MPVRICNRCSCVWLSTSDPAPRGTCRLCGHPLRSLTQQATYQLACLLLEDKRLPLPPQPASFEASTLAEMAEGGEELAHRSRDLRRQCQELLTQGRRLRVSRK
jgi:hypothetical protein